MLVRQPAGRESWLDWEVEIRRMVDEHEARMGRVVRGLARRGVVGGCEACNRRLWVLVAHPRTFDVMSRLMARAVPPRVAPRDGELYLPPWRFAGFVAQPDPHAPVGDVFLVPCRRCVAPGIFRT